MADEQEHSAALEAPANEEGAALFPQLSEVEELAIELGWKPETEYTGPEGKWKPAKDWIKVERDINRGLKQDVRGLKEQIDRMAAAGTKQTERALRRQAEELNQRFNEAVENKDAKGAAQAVKELRELEEESRPDTGSADVEADFAKRNPWYGKDEDATAYAIAVSNREAGKGRSHAEQLEAVEEAIRKRFPDVVGEKREAKAPTAVHAPGRSVSSRREKGYSDLPATVKAAADKYAKLFHDKHGLDVEKSKAEYAKDYWQDQAA